LILKTPGKPALEPISFMSRKKGILLVNLGSPDSPSVPDVRRYLREFLMDPRVLDSPWPIRFFVVNFLILPKRPKESAEAYRQIWLPEGSPLIVISKQVQALLRERLSAPVELAMRYQNPSIPDAIERIASAGVEQLLVIPMFPQFAMSSFETAVERVKEVASRRAPGMEVSVQPPFYGDPDYIEALAAVSMPRLEKGYDHLLFSFHGLPERHLHKSDPTGKHCLKVKDCCLTPSPAHATCYRAQCIQTMLKLVKRAGIPEGKYSIAFQSRLGRDPWLTPYTDHEIERLARSGIKKLQVICPAFVADCLETLEEIGMRGRESFLEAGGTDYNMIPCINTHPAWIQALERMSAGFLNGTEKGAFTAEPGFGRKTGAPPPGAARP
jgi:protoporphyrin/coproporphyrin ferrochelatase